jgi:hypothetical protein
MSQIGQVTEGEIEQEIRNKGLNAPRLNPQQIDAVIADEMYWRLTETLTVCVLTLRNGYTVTGESACASPENYDKAIGRKVARDKARDKIWALEGYLLRQRLYDAEMAEEILPPTS